LTTKDKEVWCDNSVTPTELENVLLREQFEEIVIFRDQATDDLDDTETSVPEILADSNYLEI
jgi:hypothetical protein